MFEVISVNFYENIKKLMNESRKHVVNYVNTTMLFTYWNIGKMIVDKQNGNKRAKYGELLIDGISKKLTEYFGKGFSIQNLRRMRQFYLCFPIRSALMSELSWTHYLELIKIKEKNKRDFYMKECVNSNWDVRELQRQRTTLLYERIVTIKDKNKILELANEGHKILEGKDIIKELFVDLTQQR